MSNDKLLNLRAKYHHYEEWLRRFRGAKDLLADVESGFELTKWELEALENRPTEAEAVPLEPVLRTLEAEYGFLKRNLPLMPDYGDVNPASMGTVTISGTVEVFDWVSRVGQLGTQNASTYAVEYTGRYRALQERSDRLEAARQRLSGLGSGSTMRRFHEASTAHSEAYAGVGSRSGAALAIRTLVDGLQGDLFKVARRFDGENMTWKVMAARLAEGGSGSREHAELVSQESIRSSLINFLSRVAKDREGSAQNLENLWTEAVDHIYVVCGLVRRQVRGTTRESESSAEPSVTGDAAKRRG